MEDYQKNCRGEPSCLLLGRHHTARETNDNTGHTEWPDGRVHHSGFTTVFTPNTFVPYADGGRTYVVNVLLMDGSARFVSKGISLTTWRGLGTRSGGEVIGDF